MTEAEEEEEVVVPPRLLLPLLLLLVGALRLLLLGSRGEVMLLASLVLEAVSSRSLAPLSSFFSASAASIDLRCMPAQASGHGKRGERKMAVRANVCGAIMACICIV